MGGDREKMRIRELTRTERAKIRKLVTEHSMNGLQCRCFPGTGTVE